MSVQYLQNLKSFNYCGAIEIVGDGNADISSLLTNRTLEEKYELNLPLYPGFAQIVELPQQDEESSQKL